MIQHILKLAETSEYDFRSFASPEDPLTCRFEDWVPYYRLKWAIAKVLAPAHILEIGVRYGYSAHAFLQANPDSAYLGIDNDSDSFGGSQGAIHWARQLSGEYGAEFLVANSQELPSFPGGPYDLIHIDGQQDGEGSMRDLRKALNQGRYVLVDGFFWSRTNFLHVSQFLYHHRDSIEYYLVIPGYAGELLIKVRSEVTMSGQVEDEFTTIRNLCTKSHYLSGCEGYEDPERLQSVWQIADLAPAGRALDLGCGRGAISLHLARSGRNVLAIDESENAIELAREAANSQNLQSATIEFFCGHVNHAPLDGVYDVAVASDLIEHLMPAELEELYARVSSHLSPEGLFVVHTFPNLWYYKYGYGRRLRKAKQVDAYLPLQPRSRYEELMHINEQSPRVLRSQLRRHFPHVLLWFANHELSAPYDNLSRYFSRGEIRDAADLFAIASHRNIDRGELLRHVEMQPVEIPIDLSLRLVNAPEQVRPGRVFRMEVELTNGSEIDLKSQTPHPVNLAYHWLAENGEIFVFDGWRTPLGTLPPHSVRMYSMQIEPPARPGRYTLRATLVQEGLSWFDIPPQSLWVDRKVDVVV